MDTIPQDDAPRKQCKDCKGFFPATLKYFHAHQEGMYGLNPRCKVCRNASQREKEAAKRPPKEVIPEGHKKCTKCKDVFPADNDHFIKHSSGKFGLHPRCKKCQAEDRQIPEVKSQRQALDKNYNKTHKEEIKKRYQSWYEVNKDTVKMHRRAYWSERKEQKAMIIKRCKRSEEAKVRRKQYERTHRQSEHGKAYYRAKNTERRARKKAVPGSYAPAQIQEQLKRQHYHCYYAACGFAKFPRVRENGKWKYIYEVEHTFPISRVAGTDIPANDISYLVLSCESCNSKKGNKFPWEFFEGGRLL